jgi:stage V sporulation protein B
MRLSLPLAFSSYARTALSTLQHLLVPRALRRSGETAAAALGVYGTVSGMVFPVLTFASVFFNALSELLIPELTRSQVRGDQAGMDRTAGRILSGCLLFSAAASFALFLLGPWLGRKLYRSAEAGMYLRLLSPLVVVMYLDSVVDGMLKGLGLHLSSMVINIADAVLTLAGVFFLLPRFGVRAYIALIYGSECFNFLLSFLRLRRLLPIKLLRPIKSL